MRYINLVVFFLISQIASLYSQSSLKNVIPPSPNTASLGKYGDIPVGLYTGIPNISIPLYEIKDGELSLPISLSYHAAGVKVEEIPSSVGLGWTLNAGGMVGASVRGLQDELGDWYPKSYPNTVDGILESNNMQAIYDINDGIKDGEADVYYYNFNQQAGKFFFDQTGTPHTYPLKNIAITRTGQGWQIATEDGTVYSFTKNEEVHSSGCSEGSDQHIYSAWYLTSIKSADGKREITFTYEEVWIVSTTLLGQIKYFYTGGTGTASCFTNPAPCQGTNQNRTHRLTRIDFVDGFIKFNYNNVRCDLVDDKSLDLIEIYTKSNELIKKFNLSYSYFGDNSDGVNRLTENNKRLKLLSVTEASSVSSKPPYVFEYEESIALPGRLSYARDHWGYYNGKSNTDLIASFTATTPSGNAFFAGADRKANALTGQAAILKKIKFPTGGETLFTYENNTVSDNRVEYEYTEQGMYLGAPGYQVSTLPNPFESSSLTIPSGGSNVSIIVSGLESWPWPLCDIVQLQVIKDNNTTPWRTLINSNSGMIESWPAGTYKLKLVTECPGDAIANFYVSVTAQLPVEQTYAIRTVGGLRVKQIEDKPGNGQQSLIKNYRYHLENIPTKSSGVLVNFPDYGYDLTLDHFGSNPGGAAPYIGSCTCKVRQSFSNYPMATSQGGYIGYGHVIEDFGSNGETRHTFNAYENLIGVGFPFAPVESYDWRRGFELMTKYYSRNNNQLALIKEIFFADNILYGSQFTVHGIKTGRNQLKLIGGSPIQGPSQFNPIFQRYSTVTEFHSIKKKTERIYDQNDPLKYVETVTDYAYNPQHLQIIQTSTSAAKSDQSIKDEIVVNKKYALDYTFTGTPSGSEALGIKKLQDLHVINVPIEEYTVRQKRNTTNNQLSDQRVIKSGIITFKPDNPYPDNILMLETNSPISLTSYGNGSSIVSNTFVNSANSTISSAYKPSVIFNNYDNKGNIITQQKANDVKQSYVWGYNNSYPIAQIINAQSNQIFHTSFEGGDGNSATGDCKTGKKSKTDGFSTSLSNLTSGNYILSYWQKPGATWVLQSSTINVAGTTYNISLPGQVDEVRFYPEKALMTTYTYEPLIGITTQTDANNRTTYYEYDGFGRLSLIRDNDNNILKKICYNYAGQPESCPLGVGNVQKSGTFTRSNCGSGYIGSAVTYTVPANTYFGATQADADAFALNDVNTNGQVYANQNGTCTIGFYNVAKSGTFARNNCAAGGTGSTVTYTVAAGTYSSIISQADADQKAQNDVSSNGQNYANANGTCTWKNVSKSGTFTRNNCATGGTGSSVTYTVAAGAYSSTISQADADSKAQNDVNTNGQTYANNNGYCTWYSVVKSGTFTRNNCATGGTGSSVTYTVAAGAYSSTLSQADADSKAQNDVNTNGQTYANNNGTCTWYSVVKSGSFTRNNCPSGYTGSTVTYTVAAGAYSSTISPADADSKAQNDVNNNGQTYANNNGACLQPCSITINSGYYNVGNGINSDGTTVSFGFAIYSYSTLSPGTPYNIGTINGGCKPSGNRSFTFSSSGRTWSLTVSTSGQMTLVMAYGSPLAPYTVIGTPTFTYNL